MSGNSTATTQALIQSELWHPQMDEIITEAMLGATFYEVLPNFAGEKLTFTSMSEPVVRTRGGEFGEVTFDTLDTGEKSMVKGEEVYSSNRLSKKFLQDAVFAPQMLSQIPSMQARKIMEYLETDMLSLAMNQFAGTDNLNAINGTNHRFIGSGTGETLDISDLAYVPYSLEQAGMSRQGVIGIVDPSAGLVFENLIASNNISNNIHFEGVVSEGFVSDHRFVKHIAGVDVYTSTRLPTMNETIDGLTTTAGKAGIFMSLGSSQLPFSMAWQENPNLKSEMDFKTEAMQLYTTARWGKMLREDRNLVVIGHDTDTV